MAQKHTAKNTFDLIFIIEVSLPKWNSWIVVCSHPWIRDVWFVKARAFIEGFLKRWSQNPLYCLGRYAGRFKHSSSKARTGDESNQSSKMAACSQLLHIRKAYIAFTGYICIIHVNPHFHPDSDPVCAHTFWVMRDEISVRPPSLFSWCSGSTIRANNRNMYISVPGFF